MKRTDNDMSSLPSNHARSVYVNSCRSAPKEKMSSYRSKSDSMVSLNCKQSSCHKYVNLGETVHTHSCCVQRPVPSTEPDANSSSMFQSSDFTTLITTLLESNRLLHNEIQKMKREHSKTMTTLTQFCHKQTKYETHSLDSGCLHVVSALGNISVEAEGRVIKGIDKGEKCGDVGGDGGVVEVGEEYKSDAKCSNRIELEVNVTDVNRKEKESDVGGREMVSGEEDSMKRVEGEIEKITGGDEDYSADDAEGTRDLLVNYSDSDYDDEGMIQLDSVPVDFLTESSSCSMTSGSSSCGEEDQGEGENLASQSDPDPFPSPGMEAVNKMWERFSVNDYDFITYFEGPVVKSKQKKWTPRITVPQPFSMTIREANNSPLKKSKSLEIAEKEVLELKAVEDAESKKKFHATPIPANTFLPLFELINARNEQRRDTVKKECAKMLEATQKPFSFYKRDILKHEQREKILKQCQEQEVVILKKNSFKAKPVPSKLFDPEIEEKIWEEEEYRRIRSKMRAEELLAKSKLPSRMQESTDRFNKDSGEAYKKKLEQNECKAFLTEEHSFHPHVTHDIPDYKEKYRKFQQQLELKKRSKCTTVPEPFQLQTDAVCSRRRRLQDKLQVDEVKTKLPSRRFSRTHRTPRRSPYSAQMTQTARLRQSKMQEKLAELMHKELEEEEDRRAERIQRRMMQKAVSKKTSRLDPTKWSEESKRRKMEEFRQRNRENFQKFQQQLQDMEDRVAARPFLLEQASQKSGERSKEFYTSALTKSGFSEEEIKGFLQNLQNDSLPEGNN